MAADILKVAGGRVSSPFAAPAEAGLRRQVGEACGPAFGYCDFGRAGFSCYGIRSVNNAEKHNPACTPQAPRRILVDGDHAITCHPLGCLLAHSRP